MNFLEILGLIFASMLAFGLTLTIKLLCGSDIKDFFYGLFTWQKKVPVYRDIGNNQFSNVLAAMFPIDHYEWQPREIPNWIKKLFKIK